MIRACQAGRHVRDYNPGIERLVLNTLVAAARLLLAAQQTPAPKPGFKSNLTVVEMDVVVTGKSG